MFNSSSSSKPAKPDLNKIKSRDDLLEAHEDIKDSIPLMNTDQPIIKEGWLKKQSKYLQQYRKRWIVFQPNHIYSYKKQQLYKYHTEDIDLRQFVNIKEENENNEFEFIIENGSDDGQNNNNKYKFIANSENDRNEWILTIKNWLKFSLDIAKYRKKWKSVIYDRTVKRMEMESLNIINCICMEFCQCTKRVIFILKFYRIWCLSLHCNYHLHISIESIIKHQFGFGTYNTIQLINDFHHVTSHYYKNKTHFFNYFTNELGVCVNNNKYCYIYFRNNRDRNRNNRNKIYYKYTKSSDVVAMQLLDTFHCFISHNFDKQIKEKKEMKENIDIDIPVQQDNTIKYSKFMSDYNGNNHNFTYWLCDKLRKNYVSPKYTRLKQEILYNNIYSLDVSEWNIIREKAMKYRYCLIGKSMLANNISKWNNKTQIHSKTPISIKHIIVLLLNTNYCQLNTNFKQQFNLKKRNQVIANFCKLLFESVYLFGNIMYNDEDYYLQINCKPLFNSFPMLTFKTPISVTTNKRFIINICNGNESQGCILQLRSYRDATMPYFNVNWLTDNVEQDEKLLFRIHLNINNIITTYQYQSNNNMMMKAFKLFIAICEGKFFADFDDNTQILLSKMLEEEEKKENESYINDLFNHYVKNKQEYWINESQFEELNVTLCKTFASYLETIKNIKNVKVNKIQLFSWHIDINKDEDEDEDGNEDGDGNGNDFNGPTLLYTLDINNDSFQIAFDTFIMSCNTFYFSLSSMPINLKRITVSFYLYCIEKDFYAQIEDYKMSLYHSQDGLSSNSVKRVGYKIRGFNIVDLENEENEKNKKTQKNKKLTWKIAVKVTDTKI